MAEVKWRENDGPEFGPMECNLKITAFPAGELMMYGLSMVLGDLKMEMYISVTCEVFEEQYYVIKDFLQTDSLDEEEDDGIDDVEIGSIWIKRFGNRLRLMIRDNQSDIRLEYRQVTAYLDVNDVRRLKSAMEKAMDLMENHNGIINPETFTAEEQKYYAKTISSIKGYLDYLCGCTDDQLRYMLGD